MPAEVEAREGSANCYFFGGILIDAPAGIDFSVFGPVSHVMITHEHCDHFAGLDDVACGDICASASCAGVINGKRREGLCSPVGYNHPNKKVTRVLKEGDIIEGAEGAGVSLRVIETPGHARGAICLYEEERKLLFSGDTVFPDYSMPRVDLPTSEPERLMATYEKLAALDIVKIFPGHGDIIEEKGYVKKLMRFL